MTDENQPKVTRSYATARAFREALERRLNAEAATTRTDVMRLRRQVAFDRFLARLFSAENSPWVLKGGYACELRLGHRARATKDIDLTLPHHLTTSSPSPADQIRDMLQDAAAEDLGDRFVFVVAKAKEQLVAPPYGGVRYPVTATPR